MPKDRYLSYQHHDPYPASNPTQPNPNSKPLYLGMLIDLLVIAHQGDINNGSPVRVVVKVNKTIAGDIVVPHYRTVKRLSHLQTVGETLLVLEIEEEEE